MNSVSFAKFVWYYIKRIPITINIVWAKIFVINPKIKKK